MLFETLQNTEQLPRFHREDLTEKISQKEDFIKKIRQEQNVPDKG